ncbi:DUF2062 domain-containing protein [Jannaschia seohaensis]|uniref:DUF2062 domain-containing protein n=1 Tax=Jannaschia seohaensis TaxID=475081 RepID=A0A2Y9ADR6_9RHOB|nr:DUF2062 domain-containing protein [Jannaschia seohaensis]PWJ20988.1 hypothetical protein BCF38_102235 [Jannaschia seohaensis]SSA41398.1 hypothetical protein SAMN05421539_102235 [Jannaschia seohaensis]
MVFKRRDRLPIWQTVLRLLWPQGGWGRAAIYVKHRLRRLPDTPRKISRGIMVGVFTTFTPLYGVHFMVAALLAVLVRGNVMAALLGTFFGNPLTYVPIGVVSLNLGHWMLGTEMDREVDETIFGKFWGAGEDLFWNGLYAITGRPTNWDATILFWHDVFWPWMVGGIFPGLVTGVAAYAVSLPLIEAYQRRRRGALKKKLDAIRARAAEKAAAKKSAGAKSKVGPARGERRT